MACLSMRYTGGEGLVLGLLEEARKEYGQRVALLLGLGDKDPGLLLLFGGRYEPLGLDEVELGIELLVREAVLSCGTGLGMQARRT